MLLFNLGGVCMPVYPSLQVIFVTYLYVGLVGMPLINMRCTQRRNLWINAELPTSFCFLLSIWRPFWSDMRINEDRLDYYDTGNTHTHTQAHTHISLYRIHVQSNLCTTTTLGNQNLWPLLTDGRCSEVTLFYKTYKWDSKMVVVIDRWSLFGGGR